MTTDERAIRDLVATWLTASQAGDFEKVLSLMSDDVVFMVPGKEPFGKKEYAASTAALQDVRMEAKSDLKELRVLGDWAYLRSHLTVTMTPRQGGAPNCRSGYTLTIFAKQPDGRWQLVRDANLLGP